MNIEDDIKEIFNALINESEKKSKEIATDAIERLKLMKISDPENFNTILGYKIEMGLTEIVKTLHKPPLDKIKNKSKPNFIYLKYNYLSKNIENLCISKEKTSCCSVDKSRSIIRMYFDYSMTEQIPEFDPNQESYSMPNFGTYEEWINFCEGLYELYYGRPEKYLNSLKALMDSEIRKYKHILHNWYIRFSDETVVEFTSSWDDNVKNPLDNECFNKGDYYVVNERYLDNRNYERDEENSNCLVKYCRVPKSEIKEIFKISIETLV